MNVIGKTKEDYIVTVSHTELEKVADKYYGNMKRLEVGDKMNLGEGYDFSYQIKTACESMQAAMKKFEDARDTLMRFAIMVNKLPEES